MNAAPSTPHAWQEAPATLHQSETDSDALARLIHSRRSTVIEPAQLHVGTVITLGDSGSALGVRTQDGHCVPASLAAGCLLLPQTGDLVQVLTDRQGCWIVHVLEHGDATAPRTLQLGPGTVHIRAEALHLQAQDLHLQADSLQETAQRKQSHIQGWSTTRAAFVDIHAERQLNLFGDVTTLVADALLKVDGAQIHMG